MWTVAFARFDMKEFSAREARYGLRGVRIGEASHPGPPKFSRCGSRSREISLAGIYLPDSDSESDDEPLVSRRPGLRRSGSRDESRNVAPRVDRGDPGETVLWIPRRLRVAPQSLEDDLRTTNRFAALRAPEEDSAQATSPGPVVPSDGRVAVAGNARPMSKRLRLTSGGSAVDTPADTLIDAIEFDLTREDSSSDEMCPDAEVGATEVDPEAPTSAESRDSQPVHCDSDVSTPHQSSIPIGVTGDAVPSIHTSDTESIVSREGHSDCEGDQDPVPISDPPLPPVAAQLERFSASFEWLASVDVESLFAKRACLMKAVPGFMKGAYRSAMRIALAEIDEGRSHQAILRSSRGWKLFLLLPRLLLHRSPEGARFRKHSCNVGWKHSRVESGHLFWPANERVQPEEFRLLRVASDVQSVTISRAGPPEPRLWCTWASYLQPATRSKVQHWHQGQTRRWPCCRTR